MLKYKEGVTGDPMPPLAWALAEVDSIYAWFGLTATVTAIRNGEHKPGSLHARGYAADIRIWDIPTTQMVKPIFETIKKQLVGFDVILETDATPGATAQHFHLEFDPEGNGGINLP